MIEKITPNSIHSRGTHKYPAHFFDIRVQHCANIVDSKEWDEFSARVQSECTYLIDYGEMEIHVAQAMQMYMIREDITYVICHERTPDGVRLQYRVSPADAIVLSLKFGA